MFDLIKSEYDSLAIQLRLETFVHSEAEERFRLTTGE